MILTPRILQDAVQKFRLPVSCCRKLPSAERVHAGGSTALKFRLHACGLPYPSDFRLQGCSLPCCWNAWGQQYHSPITQMEGQDVCVPACNSGSHEASYARIESHRKLPRYMAFCPGMFFANVENGHLDQVDLSKLR